MSEITVNLAPAPPTGLMQRLMGSKPRRRASGAVWAVDLGRRALRAVRMARAADGRPCCDRCEVVEITRLPGASETEIRAAQTAALKSLLAKEELRGAVMGLNLPGADTFTRFFRTPPVQRPKLEALVHYEMKTQVPFDIELLSWNYHVLSGPTDDSEFDEFEVLMVGARNQVVKERLECLAGSQAKLELLQSDPIALHNARRFHQTATGAKPGLALLLDVGMESMNLLVTGEKMAWLRNVRLGGEDFTRAVVRGGRLTHEQAEVVLRSPASPDLRWKTQQALAPVFDQLAGHVIQTLRGFENIFPDRKIERLTLVGGGSRPFGLIRELRQRLK